MSAEASKSATEIITCHETFKRPSLQILGSILNWLIQWDKALLVRKCIAQHQFGSAKSAQAAFPAQLPVGFWAWNNKAFRLHLFPFKNFLQMNLCSQKFRALPAKGGTKWQWENWFFGRNGNAGGQRRTPNGSRRKENWWKIVVRSREEKLFFLLFSAQISRGEFSPPVSMPGLATFEKSSPGGRKICGKRVEKWPTLGGSSPFSLPFSFVERGQNHLDKKNRARRMGWFGF